LLLGISPASTLLAIRRRLAKAKRCEMLFSWFGTSIGMVKLRELNVEALQGFAVALEADLASVSGA